MIMIRPQPVDQKDEGDKLVTEPSILNYASVPAVSQKMDPLAV